MKLKKLIKLDFILMHPHFCKVRKSAAKLQKIIEIQAFVRYFLKNILAISIL